MHLLPEALGLHSHTGSVDSHHDHGHSALDSHLRNRTILPCPKIMHDDAAKQAAIWKCCVCFGGIYMFFLIERAMALFREYKRRREDLAASPSKILENRTPDRGHTHIAGFKFSGTAHHCVRPCDSDETNNKAGKYNCNYVTKICSW